MLFLRIKVPIEVALPIIAIGLLILVLALFGQATAWLRNKLGATGTKVVAAIVALLTVGGGMSVVATFLTLQLNRHPVHYGLSIVSLDTVALAAILLAVGAYAMTWANWDWVGAAIASMGLLFVVKPMLWPFKTYDYKTHMPDGEYGLTSETHLYFLLSGVALLVMAVVLVVRAVGARKSG